MFDYTPYIATFIAIAITAYCIYRVRSSETSTGTGGGRPSDSPAPHQH